MFNLTHIFSALAATPMTGFQLGPEGAFPWLTLTTFAPMLGILVLMLMPREQVQALRNVALLTSLVVFGISLSIMAFFHPSLSFTAGEAFTFQLAEGPYPWVEALGISYHVGVDGFSLWLVMLTTFIVPIAIVSTYSAVNTKVKEYMICLLFLEVGMLGALVALDVFLFYVFWELMLIPMYFIIGVWGGKNRIEAAMKFFLYTVVGSVLMLVAILYVYVKAWQATGNPSFLFSDLLAAQLSYPEQIWLFAAFFLAFAIKVPLFPLHTWLPLAHVEAPTAGSVILAAVMLKLGTYGLVRFAFPFFPDAVKFFAPYIAILSVIGIVYGALLALVQDDVKKLVAYSSVSHLGFCVLGLIAMTPQGIAGAMFVMLAHGIATSGLFLCVGVLYERRHTRQIADFGGIARVMPLFAVFFMFITFASAGLPGLNGFVGEFLALIGTSKSHFLWFTEPLVFMRPEGVPEGYGTYELGAAPFFPMPEGMQAGPEVTAFVFAIVATSGVILGAAYLLWMFKRVMFGPVTHEENRQLAPLSPREIAYLVPIVVMAVFMGIYPKFFLSRMDMSIHQFLTYMDAKVTAKGSVVVEPPAASWLPKGPLAGGPDEPQAQ